MIPYVISEAYPDYKRPCVEHDFGVVKEEEMETYFLDRVSNFVLDRTGDNDLSLQDVNDFFDNYFDEYFMMNDPWSAMVFRNGEWENVRPSNDKIWGHIRLIILQEQQEEELEKEEDEKEEDILNENDKIILTGIKAFLEKMLEEKPLQPEQIETIQKMNRIQQLLALFNIYLTNENYTQNSHLFKGFLNVCVKFFQKHIEDITKKMEIEHTEELSKQLEEAMWIYSNTILVKDTLNI